MTQIEIERYALIMVFDYKLNLITDELCGVISDPPGKLLSMHLDLEKAYVLSTDQFKIKRKNITIVTDIQPTRGVMRPWEPLRASEDNPRIVLTKYPHIGVVIREIAQFIENTIRGIQDIVDKGMQPNNEVFVYFSGHGAQISIDNGYAENALILFGKHRKNGIYERRYLRANDIFRILFGHNPVTNNGLMNIPITRRRKITGGYLYEEAEQCSIQLTPTKICDKRSPRETYETERGIPDMTGLLVVFDTCHSAKMADFHYVYSPTIKTMKPTKTLQLNKKYPLCVSLAAADDPEQAPSTSNGSPFTACVFRTFTESECGMNIRQFNDSIYSIMPKILSQCRPKICSTRANPEEMIPFLTHLEPCEIPTPKFIQN